MTLAEERLKVLQMVKDGKISAEDAAELLAALDIAAERKAAPLPRPSRPAPATAATAGCACASPIPTPARCA